MKNTVSSDIKRAILAAAIVFTFMQAAASAQGDPPARDLEGVWLVNVMPRNCATGEPIAAAAFESLMTFHRGGTVSMSIRNNTNTPTLVRTPFHGLWRSDHGWSEYTFKVVHIRSSASTGAFAGKQESGGAVVLSESGDEFTVEGYTIVYNVDGVPVGAPGCSNSLGTRFRLD